MFSKVASENAVNKMMTDIRKKSRAAKIMGEDKLMKEFVAGMKPHEDSLADNTEFEKSMFNPKLQVVGDLASFVNFIKGYWNKLDNTDKESFRTDLLSLICISEGIDI